MTKWEYRAENFEGSLSPERLVAYLNKLGQEHWELAALDRGRCQMVLKRAVQETTQGNKP